MTHPDSHEHSAAPETGLENRFQPSASVPAPYPLTRLDIATLAAGATRHSADAALRHKLLAAGLLREDARTGYLDLTEKAYALLEENGYTFVPKQGWRLDTARAVRAMQPR
jgi:hypothetical protein